MRSLCQALGAMSIAVAALVGCTAQAPATSPLPPEGSSLAVWLEFFEERGELQGVSVEQRDVLQAAATDGQLTYEALTGLIQLTFDCVERQGLRATWLEPHTDAGYPVPAYGITESLVLGSEASQAVMDECVNRYSALAEQLYVGQPVNVEIEAALWERAKRAPMIACLREHGIEVDDDAPRLEIEVAAVQLGQATGPTNAPVFGPNCWPSEE